jgi:hypothetical protein
MLWDRTRDTFELGQWLKGRIFGTWSDGRCHMRLKGSWTAISCAPWLKAIALFPKGDTWGGGGLFTSNTTYWLDSAESHGRLHDTEEVQRDRGFRPSGSGSIYHHRLLRGGWTLTSTERRGPPTYEKRLPNGFVLRKFRGARRETHELENPESGERIPKPDWEWADVDGPSFVWAERGCLYRGDGIGPGRLLHDFRGMKFEPRIAPY